MKKAVKELGKFPWSVKKPQFPVHVPFNVPGA